MIQLPYWTDTGLTAISLPRTLALAGKHQCSGGGWRVEHESRDSLPVLLLQTSHADICHVLFIRYISHAFLMCVKTFGLNETSSH